MKRITIYIPLLLFFAQLWAMPSLAQVLMKSTVDRDRILIGEPITLSLELRAPLGSKIDWTIPDSIAGFVVTEKKLAETKETLDGKIVQQQIAITSFDSGHRVLPVFRIKVNDKAYSTDTIGIDVGYAVFDPNEDYRPIKEIEEVQVPPRDYRLWFAAAVTLLLLAGIVYMLIKRKAKRVAAIAESRLSPLEEAMKELETLRKQARTNNGEIKTYYTKLNDIVRRFLMRRWQITSLQQTNDELVKQLEKFNLPREDFDRLQQALRTADFVKFAKYLPDEPSNEKSFAAVQSAITLLNNPS